MVWMGIERKDWINQYYTSYSGKLRISFGNCWYSGNVTLYLNGVMKSYAIPLSNHKSMFKFKAGDELMLCDEGDNSIIRVNSIELLNCY